MTIDIEKPAADAASAPRRRVTRPARRPVAAIIALCFFFGPLGAFVLGARPEAIENRALADFPSLSQGWDFFPSLTSWATDHLPLRADAIRANASFSERVFHEAPSYRTEGGGAPGVGIPSGHETAGDSGDDGAQSGVQYPQVIQGDDGWLYFGPDVSNLCNATRSVSEVLSRLNRLGTAVEASGRKFVLVVAPDKTTMVPQHLPSDYLGEDCAAQRRTEFWNALSASPPVGYLDLRGPLKAEQERTGDPIYRPNDTHWGPLGAAVYVQQLAQRLDPALGASTSVADAGQATEPGDLSAMIGTPKDDKVTNVQLERPGVTPVGRDSLAVPEMPYSPETFRNKTSDAPLFQPRTFVLGDSFTNASTAMIGQLFSSITLLHNEVAGPYPQAVADTMADSDVVVYEIVERTISSGGGALIDDGSLTAIEATLAANPR
jgi:alginate O-acetyltransferase complex protein AlgJ